jgi:isocitrate dehydrogenase (NAD+)
MLDHIGQGGVATRIRAAMEQTLHGGIEHITPDLGGTASTMDFADAIVRRLEA